MLLVFIRFMTHITYMHTSASGSRSNQSRDLLHCGEEVKQGHWGWRHRSVPPPHWIQNCEKGHCHTGTRTQMVPSLHDQAALGGNCREEPTTRGRSSQSKYLWMFRELSTFAVLSVSCMAVYSNPPHPTVSVLPQL